MRFRSKLLQPRPDDSEPTLTKILDVYRTPEGHIEGQDENMAEILERDYARLLKKGVCIPISRRT
jgi:hypothetical protein